MKARACSLAELRESGRKVVAVDGRSVGLFLSGERVYALENKCPHAGGPLAEGKLEGLVVECPDHGWKYNVSNGEGRTLLAKPVPARAFRTSVEDGQIWIEVQP